MRGSPATVMRQPPFCQSRIFEQALGVALIDGDVRAFVRQDGGAEDARREPSLRSSAMRQRVGAACLRQRADRRDSRATQGRTPGRAPGGISE